MDAHMKSCCFTQAARGTTCKSTLRKEEEQFICEAMKFLDRPGLLIRLANKIGKPIEVAVQALPTKHQKKIRNATQVALQRGLKEVTKTIPARQNTKELVPVKNRTRQLKTWHTAASFGVGAAGGFFGLFSLPIELPLTTAIILRSVAAIADESGMDLNDPQVQLECLYILSLGSPGSDQDDALASAYWTSRTAFARLTHEAASEINRATAPILVKFLAKVAARFEFIVSEKLVAEAVPILGAIGGGVINATFTSYFSQAARYHFGLRALENKHGREAVEYCYSRLRTPEDNTRRQ
jgi:hypothetical protein